VSRRDPGHSAGSGDGGAIYFLRALSNAGEQEMWSRDLASGAEKKIGAIGPFRPIDVTFDVSVKDVIVSAPYHQGRSELWMADIR
jgi:hypothetical protein